MIHVHFIRDKENLIIKSDRLCTTTPQLNENQRNQAIGMLRAGAMINHVAQHFGCSRQTSHNLTTRFTNTGSVGDLPRSGRPPVTSGRDDRVMTLSHLVLVLLRNYRI